MDFIDWQVLRKPCPAGGVSHARNYRGIAIADTAISCATISIPLITAPSCILRSVHLVHLFRELHIVSPFPSHFP